MCRHSREWYGGSSGGPRPLGWSKAPRKTISTRASKSTAARKQERQHEPHQLEHHSQPHSQKVQLQQTKHQSPNDRKNGGGVVQRSQPAVTVAGGTATLGVDRRSPSPFTRASRTEVLQSQAESADVDDEQCAKLIDPGDGTEASTAWMRRPQQMMIERARSPQAQHRVL